MGMHVAFGDFGAPDGGVSQCDAFAASADSPHALGPLVGQPSKRKREGESGAAVVSDEALEAQAAPITSQIGSRSAGACPRAA